MRSRTRRPRILRWAGLTALLFLIAPSGSALAQESGQELPLPKYGFGATMTTNGTRFSVIAPSFLAFGDNLVDLGAPVAQALLNSSGQSEAFSSFPYPGELVVTVGDLVGGATGVASPLPPYPLFLKSTFPNQPENTLSVGVAELATTTSLRRALAKSTFQVSPVPSLLELGSVSGTADAKINDDGQVEVSGTTIIRGAVIGGLFRIGELRSEVRGVLDANGKPTWTSHLELTGASIAGIGVTVTPDGLKVTDQVFPSLLGSADALIALLKAAGVDVEVLKAAPVPGDPTSFSSEALKVVFRQPGTRDLLDGLVPIVPPTSIQFLLGSSTGRLSAGGEPPAGSVSDQAPIDDSLAVTELPPLAAGAALDALPPLEVQPTSPGRTAAPIAPAPRIAALTARDLQTEVLMPYLILALGGFALVASVTSWRRWIAPIATRSMNA